LVKASAPVEFAPGNGELAVFLHPALHGVDHLGQSAVAQKVGQPLAGVDAVASQRFRG
jgi:hypothetical protein